MTKFGNICGLVFALVLGILFVGFWNPYLFLLEKLYGEATIYSNHYSELKFLGVKPGMTSSEVISILGEPLTRREITSPEVWRYGTPEPREGDTLAYSPVVTLDIGTDHFTCLNLDENGFIIKVSGTLLPGIREGMNSSQIEAQFGKPLERIPRIEGTWFEFSEPGDLHNKTFRLRKVLVDQNGIVQQVVRESVFD